MRWSLLLIFMLVGAVLADAAAVPADAVRPKRLVKFFDFEERDDGNFEDLPMHWYVIGRDALNADPNFHRRPLHQELIHRPGYPSFTQVRFDRREAVSGEHGFFFGLNGGSAGAYLEVGALAAIPESDYLITAQVRTRGLRRAAAQLTAYFIDKGGARIEASRASTPLLRTDDQWAPVSVKLEGRYPDAAWIGLELELLQPRPTPGSPLGAQQVILQDITGAAWFDDIAVWQLPHVQVSSQAPINIIRAPQRPQVNVAVKDLTGRRLSAEASVYDHRLRRVAHTRRPVGKGRPVQWSWTPDLPGFGWYLLDLRVGEQDGPHAGEVARTVGAVLWMPDDGPMPEPDANRFALALERLPMDQLTMAPKVLHAAGLNVAVFSVWDHDTTLHDLQQRQDVLDDILHEVMAGGGEVILSLDPVPAKLSGDHGNDATQPLGVMRGDSSRWLPYLTPALLRHGQRVQRWQLGAVTGADAFFYDNLPDLLVRVDQRFRKLVAHPRLHVPWRVGQSIRHGLPDDAVAAMFLPVSVEPAFIGDHLHEWRDSSHDVWLQIDALGADELSHERRIADLALRMIYAWEADVAGMAINKPWTDALERRNAILPDPLLGVFANTAHRLAGRRAVGRMDHDPRLVSHIFDGPRGGMIVAWNRSAPDHEAVIDAYLGAAPVVIDVWGNRAPAAEVNGKHRVPLTDEPTFITGIDTELALFRAGFTVEPSFIESAQTPHDRTITLTNPWPRTITGSFRLTGPEGWTLQPAQHHFSIASGRSATFPLRLTFPVSEVAGPKRLTARFDFTAEQRYQIDMTTPMELGLTGVDFDATLAMTPGEKPGARDAVLSIVVTNTGDTPQSLYVFASLPGHERLNRPISRLEPGETAVRRFRFSNAAAALQQHPIRAGVREINGPAILNKVYTRQDIE